MYEIRDAKTNETLVDNLTFDDMAELFAEYQAFFGDDIYAYYCIDNNARTSTVSRELEYKRAWLHYYDELQAMGNI